MSDDTVSPSPRLDTLRRALRREVLPARLPAPSARVRLKRRIDEAALPEPAKELVRRVVRRTRLWRRERFDVADELIAHFADGLAAGETAEQLVEAFGHERQAARLIRRAKRRNRPLAWHALRGLGLIIGGLLLVYAGLAVYFHLGRPSPAVNYFEALNEPIRRFPEDQRAWPLYREALLGMSAREDEAPAELRDLVASRPGDERWPEMVEWLAAHGDSLELARQAAGRRALGFVVGPGGSHVDPKLWPGQTWNTSLWPGQYDHHTPLLIAVLLPHLHELRTVANALGADAALARQAGDRERWSRDVAAMQGIARQVRPGGFVVSQLVALGIDALALDEIQTALSDAPEMLQDDDLRRLAHGLAGPDVAGDLIDLRPERMVFHDVVQRAYTDDGEGDGRFTPEGLRLLQGLTVAPYYKPYFGRKDYAALLTGGPASLLLVAPRAEVSRTYDRLMDAQAARFARPLHELGPSTMEREVGAMRKTAVGRVRHALLLGLLPAVERMQVQAERHLGRRDGIHAGLALELWRRRNGRYPESLNELTPGLLPAVPVDRVTGAPVRYRLVGGKPLVYSLGADRDDDGGVVAPPGAPVRYAEYNAEWFLPPAEGTSGERTDAPPGGVSASRPSPTAKVRDGDWILYPQPLPPVARLPRLPATKPAEPDEGIPD